MSTVNVTLQDRIAVLRLENGATNAIGSVLLADLEMSLAQVAGSARGLVLAGNEKFFSIGLNLPELIALDRDALAAFCTRLDRLAYKLYTLPIPTLCALTGHAVAGGCVLALTSDLRYIAEGKKLIGFNEAAIGLPVPYLSDLSLRQLVGDRAASDLLYSGRFLHAAEAAAVGLVDTVLPQEEVEDQAIARVAALAAQPAAAFAVLKDNRTEAVAQRFRQHHQEKLGRLLDCWFAESVQVLLREAAQKF